MAALKRYGHSAPRPVPFNEPFMISFGIGELFMTLNADEERDDEE